MSEHDAFRQYVTSTAFSLSLSANMILALEEMDSCQPRYGMMEFSRPVWSAKRALQRRGLIAWGDEAKQLGSPDGPCLTEAGRLVLQLCRLAELALPAEERRAS